jgi:hypothetical protein
MKVFFAVFLILHGLVHMLYLGQSSRFFELQTGMVWPDGSWTLSRIAGDENVRAIAAIALALAALGFVAGGIALLAAQTWWRTVIVVAAIFSSVLYVLFWDGKLHGLDNQGAIGILIDIAVLAVLLGSRWSDLGFEVP